MKRKLILTFAALALTSLSGCGSTGILDRQRPDEFAVTRAKPIVVPATFTLPAPTPDAPRPQDGDIKEQVLDALFGGTAPAPRP